MADMNTNLTTAEQYVMLAVIHLQPGGYGVTIRETIEQQSGKRLSFGSVYTVLDRLTSRGFVEATEGEATDVRGGRRKMLFKVTAPGQSALEGSLRSLDAMRASIGLVGTLA